MMLHQQDCLENASLHSPFQIYTLCCTLFTSYGFSVFGHEISALWCKFCSGDVAPILLFASIADFFQLEFEQNNSVLKQCSKHKDYTGNHPALYGS